MVVLDPMVRVPDGVMKRIWEQLIDNEELRRFVSTARLNEHLIHQRDSAGVGADGSVGGQHAAVVTKNDFANRRLEKEIRHRSDRLGAVRDSGTRPRRGIPIAPARHTINWRNGGDSNPRNLSVRPLSRRVHSSALPPFRLLRYRAMLHSPRRGARAAEWDALLRH